MHVGKVKGNIISVSGLDSTQNSKNTFENPLTARVIEQQQSIIKLLSDLVEMQKYPQPSVSLRGQC